MLLLAALPLAAQVLPGDEAPVQRYARAGRPVDRVIVLGAVGAPGIWEVEQRLDLVEFLAHLRVQGIGVRTKGQRRNTLVRIFRGPEGAQRTLAFEGDLRAIIERRVEYPPFQPGDLLVVEEVVRPRAGPEQLFTYVNTAGSLLTLTLTLFSLFR